MSFNYEYPYTDANRINDDWLLNKMKELLEAWDVMGTRFADIEKAWEEMKTFIINYFETLDLQTEVNRKLEIMAADGTMARLLAPFVAGAINPIIVNSIPEMEDINKIYILAPGGHMYAYKDGAWNDTGLIYGEVGNIQRVADRVSKIENTYEADDKISAVFEVAETYLLASTTAPEGTQILYQDGAGPYSEKLLTDGREEPGCSCSEFVMSSLNGLKFAESRYKQDKNFEAEWGYRAGYTGQWVTYGDFLSADEFYQTFKSEARDVLVNKEGTTVLNDRLKTGDILIWLRADGTAYHIAILLQTRGSRMWYVNATDSGASIYGNLRRGSQTVHQGIVSYTKQIGDNYMPNKVISSQNVLPSTVKTKLPVLLNVDPNKVGTITGSSSAFIAQLKNEAPLAPGFYTLELDNAPEKEIHFALCKIKYTKLSGETTTEAAFAETFTMVENAKGKYSYRFYADCPIESLEFRVQGPGSYEVHRVRVIKGIKGFDE